MTINGLKNTIRYDEEVFRWAIAMLGSESVRKTLPCNKIQTLKFLHISIMAANFGAAWFMFKIITPSFSLTDLSLVLGSMLAIYLLEIPYKNMAASLAGEFVGANFAAKELEKWTLLQLSVQLEAKYGICPVVEMLSEWTRLFRIAFITVYIAVTWVLFFNFSTRVGLILCGAWILRAISRSAAFRYFFKTSSRNKIYK